MMRNSPDPAPSRVDDDLYALDKAWFFNREYPNALPNAFFDAIAKSLQNVPFFKVWRVDNTERYIDLTTHSITLNPGVDYHQVQAEVKVLEGRDPSSSTLIIRITPTLIGVISLYRVFTNIDVNEKFAEHVASLIFATVEGAYHRF